MHQGSLIPAFLTRLLTCLLLICQSPPLWLTQERRSSGRPAGDTSLLGFMLEAQQADPAAVTDKAIRDQLHTFMLAGSDTTANTIAFCLAELAARPELQAQVRAEVFSVLGSAPTGVLERCACACFNG